MSSSAAFSLDVLGGQENEIGEESKGNDDKGEEEANEEVGSKENHGEHVGATKFSHTMLNWFITLMGDLLLD